MQNRCIIRLRLRLCVIVYTSLLKYVLPNQPFTKLFGIIMMDGWSDETGTEEEGEEN